MVLGIVRLGTAAAKVDRPNLIAPTSCKIEGALGRTFSQPELGAIAAGFQIHNNMSVILNLLTKVKIEEYQEII